MKKKNEKSSLLIKKKLRLSLSTTALFAIFLTIRNTMEKAAMMQLQRGSI